MTTFLGIRHPNEPCECKKKIAEFTFFIVDILDLHDMMDHKSVVLLKDLVTFIVFCEICFTLNKNFVQKTYKHIQNTEHLLFFIYFPPVEQEQ